MATNKAYYQKEILERINPDGYDVKPNTPKEKLQWLKDTFKSEYGFAISRMGESKALSEWLAGIPSAINLPFYNNEILEFAKKGGSLPANPTESQEDKILANYWDFMANQIQQAWRKYKVN
jgi:hypothetical protein